jgi:hypothetical protein
MKTKTIHFTKRTWLVFGVLVALVLAGCATPESRIRKNPAFFESLSPDDQQTIREGRVALGFTRDMVRLALGDPDRRMTRTTAQGVSEVWRYTTYETDDGVYLYRGYYHRYHGWGHPFYPYYLNYGARRTRDYLKITFSGDVVTQIEEEQ